MDTYVKIIFIIAILFISYILYSIFIFTDVSAYFEACGAGTILIDNNDRFNKPISHQSVSPCADDTTRIFGMLNLTRFQKNAVVSFIKMINDTLSNAVYYSQGTAPSVTKLSDA